MSEAKKYVWYASYGSNLNSERFLCYINGGSPEGSTRVEEGCRDHSKPLDEASFTIHYPLYFAKKATGWSNKGVAFIGLNQDPDDITYSKKYLVTTEQFLDIVKQENGGIEFDIDLNEVKEKGSIHFRESWYGNILYLGEDQGYPIFTFTAPWDRNEVDWEKPSHAYLTTIIKGLKSDFSSEVIYEYLRKKQGIKGYYTEEELASVVYHIFRVSPPVE
ncbi:hypothetical protein BIV60_14745 [Bacillus sp. MUM 116]|uniref:hypothetical protein n=1 Tax=Bacillus sp. MUM 116 TaxID=1678002 RepID=UPI0008F56C25|nr:hypothetical protein [Bacillus sp. MUM 116]OIK13063.1 hypothetical protein BIV60_14745 [Bacillus sp. MUM 116]